MNIDSVPFIAVIAAIGASFFLALYFALRTTIIWGLAARENNARPDLTQYCFLALVLVVALAVLSVPPYIASQLGISDSVEYAISAERAVREGNLALLIEGREYPSRYAPWFSLFLLAPVFLFLNGDVGSTILPVTFLAVCGAAAAYAIGRRISSTWGGMIAAFALLLDPGFRYFAGFPMTDVPGSALTVIFVGYMLALYQEPKRDALHWAALGMLAAMLGAWRPTAWVTLLPLVWFCLAAPGGIHRARRIILSFTPAAILVVMHLVYNLLTFGSPFRSGYHFWLPWPYDFPGAVFSARYVLENLEVLCFHTALPIFLVVLLASSPLMKKGTGPLLFDRGGLRRLLICIVLIGLPLVVFHAFYFYSTSRFFLPLSVLLYVGIGVTLGGFLRALDDRRLVTLLVLIIVAAATVGWRVSKDFPAPSRRYAVDAIAARTPQDAVVITGLDPVYVEPFVIRGSTRTIVPASRRIEFASKVVAWSALTYSAPYPTNPHEVPRDFLLRHGGTDAVAFVAAEHPHLIADALATGRPVFVETSALEPFEIEAISRSYVMSEVAPSLYRVSKSWKAAADE